MRSRDTSEFCRKAPKSCDEIDVFTFTTVAAFPTRITTIITQTVYVVTSVTCDVACVYTVFPKISMWAGYKSYLSINMSFYDKYVNISSCFLFPFNGIDAYIIPLQEYKYVRVLQSFPRKPSLHPFKHVPFPG